MENILGQQLSKFLIFVQKDIKCVHFFTFVNIREMNKHLPHNVNSFHIWTIMCPTTEQTCSNFGLFSIQWSWSNVKLQFSITFAKVVFLFLRPRYLTLYLSTYPSESVSCSLVQLIWWTITNVQLYPFPSNATIIRTKMMICHIKLSHSPIIWTVEHQLLLQSIK